MATPSNWNKRFEDQFCSFSDKWELSEETISRLVDITSIDKAKVKFECSKCDRNWTSTKGAVIFHYRLDRFDDRGKVKMWLIGQKCNNCEDEYEPARWYGEEIERVLRNLFKKVKEKFYMDSEQLKKAIDTSQHHASMKIVHRSELCEACARGVCGVRVDGGAGNSIGSYSGASGYGEDCIYSDGVEEYEEDYDDRDYEEDYEDEYWYYADDFND